MATATDEELLAVLERGAALAPDARATLLARAGGGVDAELLPLGERDRRILLLREALLGREVVAQDACPACGETMECSLDTRALAACQAAAPEPVRLDGYEVRLRLLTGADVAAAEAAPQPRAALVASAVVEATREGAVLPADALPRAVQDAVVAQVEGADPLAEITLDLACDQCGQVWQSLLDPACFVWEELGRWARELLGTVHVLARAYGWTEPDVLALPPARRRAYVRMVLDG